MAKKIATKAKAEKTVSDLGDGQVRVEDKTEAVKAKIKAAKPSQINSVAKLRELVLDIAEAVGLEVGSDE